MLTPLLTLGMGRTGSTVLMDLLRTSPAIHIDGGYPHESRAASATVRSLIQSGNGDRCLQETLGYERVVHGSDLVSSLSVKDILRKLIESPDRSSEFRDLAWRSTSDHIAQDDPDATIYAEKSFPVTSKAFQLAGIDHRNIVRVRDPRDIWCSVLSFNEKRGFQAFGRSEGQSDEVFLDSFVERISAMYDESLCRSPSSFWYRYEDFVASPESFACNLGAWLGTDLDWRIAKGSSYAYSEHVTSDSLRASVGRWHADIKPGHRETIESRLRKMMDRWGYL